MVRRRQLAAAPPTRHYGFAPHLRQRGDHVGDPGRPNAEAGLDRAHVDALADPHEMARAGEARQRLVDRGLLAEVKQGGRTQWRRLRKGLGMLHDASGKARHSNTPCSIRQKLGDNSIALERPTEAISASRWRIWSLRGVCCACASKSKQGSSHLPGTFFRIGLRRRRVRGRHSVPDF